LVRVGIIVESYLKDWEELIGDEGRDTFLSSAN